MADIETRVDKLETKVTTLEQQVSNVMTKLDMFIVESREARQRQDAEIREMREKQAADIREMRQDMKDMQKDFYAKVDKMDEKIDGMGKHVRNTSIAVIVGIATLVISILLK